MRTKTKELKGYTGSIQTGFVFKFAGSSTPVGYLICDGSAVSRATYSSLFATLGTTYGAGDGSTTFNLPDYRGRASVGYAASGGHTDVSTLGNNDGVAVAYRRPKHRHTTHSHQCTIYNNPITNGGGNTYFVNFSGNVWTTTSTDGGSGNTNDSTDAPAYLVLNRIIKL